MQWEYHHERLSARTETKEATFKAPPGDNYYAFEEAAAVKSEYSYETIINRLDELGRDGWELVQMEPVWSWYVREWRSGGMTRDTFTHPHHIVGWFVTLKRPGNSAPA